MKARSKKIILGSAVGVLIVPALMLSASYASADDKQTWKQQWQEKMEFRSEIKKAVESGDYNAWKELTQDRKIAEVIENEDDFGQLQQMHELRQDGQIDEANQIREQLGLPDKRHRHQNREEIRSATEAGDYSTWQEAVKNHPRKSDLSEDDFNKLVEAHKFRLEGKHDEAREILKELGLGKGGHKGSLR